MLWHLVIVCLAFFVVHADYHEPIYPVVNPCLAILDRLSQMSSAFLSCAVSRARPFKLCEGCVDYYARLQDLIDLLDKVRDLTLTLRINQGVSSLDVLRFE